MGEPPVPSLPGTTPSPGPGALWDREVTDMERFSVFYENYPITSRVLEPPSSAARA